MNRVFFVLITFYLLSVSNQIVAQRRTLILNLTGTKYDSLFISGVNINDQGRLRIKGKLIGDNKWQFSIPDTAYTNFKRFSICSQYITKNDPTERIIHLAQITGKDTIQTNTFNFDNLLPEVNATFQKSKNIKEKYIRTTEDEKVELFDATHIADIFKVFCNDKSDFAVRLKYPDFGYFFEFEDKGYSYQDYLSEYYSIVSKYPESQYLAISLFSTFNRYKSKDDLAKIFSLFSPQIKESIWGQRINNFLTINKFTNRLLPECNSGKEEPIIRDSNKYTLVLFSASWCGPCRKQIPNLKEIYKDLSGKLDMVYVSIDEQKTVEAWKKLMSSEKIPWRSLLAAKELNSVKQQYFLFGPADILVKPNGEMEKINFYDPAEKEKLYKIVNEG
jgi:thiol-disulfide isomerase/thioredoxin